MNALLIDACLWFRKEECALKRGAEVKMCRSEGCQIESSKEEYASATEQWRKDAAAIGARIMLSKEECANGMVQRPYDAVAVKDALVKLGLVTCALSTVVHISNDAAVKDVRIKLRKEECALGMGHRSSVNDVAW